MEVIHENIINVPSLEPKLKHPTIFNRFDELNEGEILTIHNDHDPKPLYYQLLGERGNIFTWEYLEEGPTWWRIRIQKRVTGEDEETIGELAAKDLRKIEIFKKYGIDFSCGGKKTVKEACADKGLDVTKVEQELQQADKAPTTQTMAYQEWGLDFFVDFMINTHHRYIRKNVPEIVTYANKVMEVHQDKHPELVEINKLVKELNSELNDHIETAEKVLFPQIKALVNSSENTSSNDTTDSKNIEHSINQQEAKLKSVGKILEGIRKLTNNYTLPEDACASYTLLYRLLEELENDTQLHTHLENNILFTRTLTLKK